MIVWKSRKDRISVGQNVLRQHVLRGNRKKQNKLATVSVHQGVEPSLELALFAGKTH